MARPLKFEENMVLRLPPGTFAAIDLALRRDETRADFVRAAVDEKLRRRQPVSAASRSRNSESGTSTAR